MDKTHWFVINIAVINFLLISETWLIRFGHIIKKRSLRKSFLLFFVLFFEEDLGDQYRNGHKVVGTSRTRAAGLNMNRE